LLGNSEVGGVDMAQAGYCAACRENVWLMPSGTCPRGHGAEQISNVYEAAMPVAAAPPQTQPWPQQQPAAQAPPKKRNKTVIIIVLVVVAVLLLCICGILTSIAIPVFNAAKANAQRKACFANERTVEGAAMGYSAKTGKQVLSVDELVPTYIKTSPACPTGGTYTWDGTANTYTCSEHGNFANAGPDPAK